jgi:hypothetical protein
VGERAQCRQRPVKTPGRFSWKAAKASGESWVEAITDMWEEMRSSAVRSSDHRLVHVLQGERDPVDPVGQQFLLTQRGPLLPLELREVHTGAERAARAGDDDDPYLRVALGPR